MFEFYGALSEDILKKKAKFEGKRNFIIVFLMSLPFYIATIICAILKIGSYANFIILSSIILIGTIIMLFAPKRSALFRLPKHIIFEDGKMKHTLHPQSKQFKTWTKKIDQISKILDFENCYIVTFKLGMGLSVTIQKNLITKGTIEEFETYFKDKIIKKTK